MVPAALSADPHDSVPLVARSLVSLAKANLVHALQPIVEVQTGAVHGYEALMRGHDRLGFASPTDLLDFAAHYGLLDAVEQFLIDGAIHTFAALPGHEGKKLFLNVDGRALAEGHGIVSAAGAVLARRRIAASAICVELPERHNMLAAGVSDVVDYLRRAGVRLAIDDFGQGMSELKVLCDHGIDYIKIDRHFSHGIVDSPRKRLLVTTIVNLAHVLGIRVIAEGVETEADYHGCREAGCDFVQGYFVAPPTCATEELQPVYSHVRSVRAVARRGRRTDEALLRGELQQPPILSETTDMNTLFETFRSHRQHSWFPVVDVRGAPQGIVHERDLKELIYRPFGRDLLSNKAYRRGLADFTTRCPTVEISTDADRILEVFANAAYEDGILVTEAGRYVGTLSATALLRVVNEKRVRTAQEQNPLTGLPGNLSISDYVAETAADPTHVRHFCYFDIDNFKPFNDRYGFQHGDRVLTALATLLRRVLTSEQVFLGHVGGDDFFAGFVGGHDEELRLLLRQLLAEFSSEVPAFYCAEDREAGFIIGLDRQGREQRFPLIRCSAAVLELPGDYVALDLNELDTIIAGLKSTAKRSASGLAWHCWQPQAGAPPGSAEVRAALI